MGKKRTVASKTTLADRTSVVIHNGSALSMVGFGGEVEPLDVFSTLVALPKSHIISMVAGEPGFFTGEDALERSGSHEIHHPVEFGKMNNWDDMEKIWYDTFFNVLRVSPDDSPVLITEPTGNPSENRDKIAEILFDVFNVPAVYIADQSQMCAYSVGKLSGIIMDVGHTITKSVPIDDGFVLDGCMVSKRFGGRDISKFLTDIINKESTQVSAGWVDNVIRDIKENYCYVALDYDKELYNPTKPPSSYVTPDGITIKLHSEDMFLAPEALFKPYLMGLPKETFGIHSMILRSLQQVDVEIRRLLTNNIILTGGTTFFPGIVPRLRRELMESTPGSTTVRVIAAEERNYASWLGGSLLASFSNFKHMWVTKQEYKECGPRIVHNKSFKSGSKITRDLRYPSNVTS